MCNKDSRLFCRKVEIRDGVNLQVKMKIIAMQYVFARLSTSGDDRYEELLPRSADDELKIECGYLKMYRSS